MKNLYFLLFVNLIFASNPQIAVVLESDNVWGSGNATVNYVVKIKNTGDEIISNVNVNNVPGYFQITLSGTQITSLAPGEEDITTFTGTTDNSIYGCFYEVQIQVTAQTLVFSTITDLSGQNYFSDAALIIDASSIFLNVEQEGNYVDFNGNNLIDIGDYVEYTYIIYSDLWGVVSQQSLVCEINDNNAIIDLNGLSGFGINMINSSQFEIVIDPNNPAYNNGTGISQIATLTGIHYLTVNDVNNNVVYNNCELVYSGCGSNNIALGYDPSPCNCAIPSGYSIATALYSVLPNRVSGSIKYDIDNNNCGSGTPIKNLKVKADNGTFNYATFTNAIGDYELLIPNNGNYTTTSAINSHFQSNPISYNILSSGQNIIYSNNNFCFNSINGFTDLTVELLPIESAIPGFNANYVLRIHNQGSTVLNGEVFLNFDDSKVNFLNASPNETSTTLSSITWNYTNLLPFESRYFSVNFGVNIPPIVNDGDVLNFTVIGSTLTTDDIPNNNTYFLNQVVVNSHDPNDITVLEGNQIFETETDDYLHYIVRFQNTGTASATTVVVRQELDLKLNWETFEPIASSHDSFIQLNEGNKLIYTFSNINLQDSSTNEPDSHGWLLFRIKPKSTIQVGDIINEIANIYFDYNLPVITNTATTEVVSVLQNDSFLTEEIMIYPNPVEDIIFMNGEINAESVFIYNNLGQLVSKDYGLKTINVSNLKTGLYFIKINYNDKEFNSTFIKK